MKQKTILAVFLSLAFVFSASAVYANLNFGADPLDDGDITLSSSNFLYADSIFMTSGRDYALAAIVSTSDGYAGSEFTSLFIAAPGDVNPDNGAPAVPGQKYTLGTLLTQYQDTTDEDSMLGWYAIIGSPLLAFMTDSFSNVALGSASFGAVTAISSNLFVAGDGTGTSVKGFLHADSVKATPVLFSALPTCNGSTKGTLGYITNSNTAVWGATAAGGGANNVGVSCNGTDWTVYSR